jgi:hypothetical protein
MYYISINSENSNELIHYCRNCGNNDESIIQDGGCILDVQTNNVEQHFNRIVNKYTKDDPTLPRIYNMKCPNNECKSNTDTPQTNPEVVYIRYDNNNLKYLYICTICDCTWKTDQNI